ncbi:hypothetical protein D3C78_1192790 [compost metagenome]
MGTGGARSEVQHLDAGAFQLASQRLAEAAQGELAGTVDAVTRITDTAKAGADVHHHGGLAQPRQQGAGELDRRLYVEPQLAFHLFDALILQPGKLVATGVVDQHIQPFIQCGVLQQARPLLRGAQVGDHDLVTFRMGQLLAEALQCAGPASVQQQVRPLRRQLLGQRFADPAAGAREQHLFSFKLHRVSASVS